MLTPRLEKAGWRFVYVVSSRFPKVDICICKPCGFLWVLVGGCGIRPDALFITSKKGWLIYYHRHMIYAIHYHLTRL